MTNYTINPADIHKLTDLQLKYYLLLIDEYCDAKSKLLHMIAVIRGEGENFPMAPCDKISDITDPGNRYRELTLYYSISCDLRTERKRRDKLKAEREKAADETVTYLPSK